MLVDPWLTADRRTNVLSALRGRVFQTGKAAVSRRGANTAVSGQQTKDRAAVGADLAPEPGAPVGERTRA